MIEEEEIPNQTRRYKREEVPKEENSHSHQASKLAKPPNMENCYL